MERSRIIHLLNSQPGLESATESGLSPLTGGSVSPHTYHLRHGGQDFFVKETKPNEARILRILHALDLTIAPRVIYPELLGQHILVSEYVSGVPARAKRLQPHLIIAMADLHNILNDEALVRERAPGIAFQVTRQDDGFYRRSITRCAQDEYQQLLRLCSYGLPIVDEWLAIADHLRGQLETIVDAFSSMPFAWLHHDFRQGSILGDPQRLIDWGSSYGHGPFLFDLAPFLVNDPQGLDLFVSRSEICAGVRPSQIRRWLAVANSACFFGFLLWRLGNPSLCGNFLYRPAWELPPDQLDAVLRYEIMPFLDLIHL